MKRMVFVILVAVFAQNALAVEDSGYACQIHEKVYLGTMENKCQKGDMVEIFGVRMIRITQICVPGTIVLLDGNAGGMGKREGICQYRGSYREWR